MNKDMNDIPLSQSNVSLRLADIQKRCSDLIDSSEDLGDLSLVDAVPAVEENDPYDRG